MLLAAEGIIVGEVLNLVDPVCIRPVELEWSSGRVIDRILSPPRGRQPGGLAITTLAASITAIEYRSRALDHVIPCPGALAESDAQLVVVTVHLLGIRRLSTADSAVDLVRTQDLPRASLAEATGQLARPEQVAVRIRRPVLATGQFETL